MFIKQHNLIKYVSVVIVAVMLLATLLCAVSTPAVAEGDGSPKYIGTIFNGDAPVLTAGGGYKFYTAETCLVENISVGGSHEITAEGYTVYLKAEDGYTIKSVELKYPNGAAIDGFVSENNGVYCVKIPAGAPLADNVAIHVGTELQSSELIDVNYALLEWKAKGTAGTLSFTLDGNGYTIRDSASYDTAYSVVFEKLWEKATDYENIEEKKTLTSGTYIWKVSGTSNTLHNNLIIKGATVIFLCEESATIKAYNTGKITVAGGVLSVQGKSKNALLTFDGENKSRSENCISSSTGAGAAIDNESRENLIQIRYGRAYFEYARLYRVSSANSNTGTQGGALQVLLKSDKSDNVFLYATDMTIESCKAKGGGGFGSSGSLTAGSECYFYNSKFLSCTSGKGGNNAGGGAIRAGSGSGYLTFQSCIFDDNSAPDGGSTDKGHDGGGAVRWNIGSNGRYTGIFNGCTFSNNTSADRGGAILASGGLQLNACALHDNTAGYSGGAVFVVTHTQTTKGTANSLNGSVVFGPGTKIYNNGVDKKSGNTAQIDGGGLGGAIHFKVNIAMVSDLKRENYNLEAFIRGAEIYNNSAANGGAIAVSVSHNYDCGVYVYEGSHIHDNEATNSGGAIFIETDNEYEKNHGFNIEGGTVEKNTGQNGGAVYLQSGNVTMSGGTISSNDATVNGGAFYLEKGNVEISGGLLEKNNADSNGGAAYLAGGELTVSGEASVDSNSAQNGGVAYLKNGTVQIDGGEFGVNNATQNGGVVYLEDGTVNIENGTFGENTATGDGGIAYLGGGEMNISGGLFNANDATANGGVACLAGGEMTISGGTLSYNTAKNGGVAYLGGGKMTISGGLLDTNVASANGGVAYLAGSGEMHVLGGTIQNNDAAENGGVAYLEGGTLNINNSAILLGNEALTGDGGAAYVTGGTLNISGNAKLSSNKSITGNGGAAYVNGGDVTIGGECVISGNTAAISGGGICVNNGNVTMNSGTVDDNHALSGEGGGIYVSSDTKDAHVVVKTGTLSNNSAKTNGGALAVVGDESKNTNINVFIGENVYHMASEHSHDCVKFTNNTSGTSGGAVYVIGASEKANLTIYCLTEVENKVTGVDDSKSNFLMIVGGSVTLSSLSEDGKATGHGSVHVVGTSHVTGGQVYLKGSMDDILFLDSVTVEIQKTGDKFEDKREPGLLYYKLEYFENFTDKNGVTTGRYISLQLKKADTDAGETPHTIYDALYQHTGYTIIGWRDKDSGKVYSPNTKYNGEDGSLKLYAEWKINGYLITFLPGTEAGDSHTGTTADVSAEFDKTVEIPTSSFVYPGKNFVCWVDKDNGYKIYKAGDEVINLSLKDGTIFKFTAVWIACEHHEKIAADGDITINGETHSMTLPGVSYSYSEEGNAIVLKCSCSGYTETATVNAQNTVYDEKPHGANVVYSHGTWEGMSEVTYYKGNEQLGQDPINAGTYTAKITYKSYTAEITYTINKAEQSAPEKPEFVIDQASGNQDDIASILKITNSISDCEESGQKPYFRLVYYTKDGAVMPEWAENAREFNILTAYTSYYVEVYYPESENYNASAIVMSDATYYIGKVKITVVRGEGVEYKLITPDESDELQESGLTIEVEAAPGYYLTSNFSVTAVATLDPDNKCVATAKTERAIYLVSNIPDNSELTITISGAAQRTVITATVQEGQIFGSVSGESATLTSDASFTSMFVLTNYDSGSYEGLSLEFGSQLPVGTTVIMLTNNTYWYYHVTEETKEIALTDMFKMGTKDEYTGPSGDATYLFVVDFSKATTKLSAGELTTNLTATKSGQADVCVPEFEENCPVLKITLIDPVIKVEVSGTTGLEQTLSVKLNSDAYSDKAAVIVLKPRDPQSLPIDAYFKVINGEYSADVYRNAQGEFIIPVRQLSASVSITLSSALFPNEATDYTFDAEYYTSLSAVAAASKNGVKHGEIELTFEKSVTPTPSISVREQEGKHVFVKGRDTSVNMLIDVKALENCRVNVTLSFKGQDGTYVKTAVDEELTEFTEIDQISQATYTLPLENYEPERTYCFVFRVTDTSGAVLFEIPYYFILQK